MHTCFQLTKPTVLDCTYSVLSLSRIKKRQTKRIIKSQKPNQKEQEERDIILLLRDILACFSNIWGQHMKTGFHKSQGTEIRRTDGQHRF